MINIDVVWAILIIFFIAIIMLSIFLFIWLKKKDDKFIIKFDQLLSVLNKSIFTLTTLAITSIGLYLTYESNKINKEEFKYELSTTLLSANVNTGEIKYRNNSTNMYSIVTDKKKDGSFCKGIAIDLTNQSKNKKSIKTLSIKVDKEEEEIQSFYSYKIDGDEKDSSKELWIEPNETLRYLIPLDKMKKAVEACEKRLESDEIPKSNYLYIFQTSDGKIVTDEKHIYTTIVVEVGSGEKFEFEPTLFAKGLDIKVDFAD